LQASIDTVKNDIGAIYNMDSFSGKAADQAKQYSSDIHFTLLSTFSKLFDDLYNQLNVHINTFESSVDSGGNARIQSNYLEDVKEDIQDVYDDLRDEKQSIDEVIEAVTDISSVSKPHFANAHEVKGEAVESINDLQDDLDAFTQQKQEESVKNLIHHIKITMNRASTTKGEARFYDYADNIALEGLPVLKETAKKYEREKMFDQLGLSDPMEIAKNTTIEQQDEENYIDKMQASETNELRGQPKEKDAKDGAGIVEWKEGNKEISRGETVDYEALGIDPDKTTVNGHAVHYTYKDGDFIIFKDNPDLTYYTNGAEMGTINYHIADTSKTAATFYGSYILGRIGVLGAGRFAAIDQAINKVKPSGFKGEVIERVGPMYFTDEIQNNIPIWKEIVGTSVPKIGTKEVILYISEDDGENWNGKMRFVIKPDGEISHKEF